jgi:hypothetical protein
MTLKPFEGFKSLETHHCVTGSMLHIYDFYDHEVSEDMLLGIGAGLGFIYWHQKGMPPMFGGRGNVGRPGEEGLEIITGRRTGVRAEKFYTGSARKAEKTLLAMLEAGEPVMIVVDMGFLPYFEDLPEDFHFGGHGRPRSAFTSRRLGGSRPGAWLQVQALPAAEHLVHLRL